MSTILNVRLRIGTLVLAFACVSLLLLVLVANNRQPLEREDKIQVNELDMRVVLPPPPPPPSIEKKQKMSGKPKLNLQYKNAGPKLTLSSVNGIKGIPEFSGETDFKIDPIKLAIKIDVKVDTFKLDELDNLPVLLTPLRIRFTRAMRKAKVEILRAKLLVVINDLGEVELKDVVENQFPEMLDKIKKLVNKARFTAPVRNGEVVSAEFLWPLELKNSW